MLGTRTVAHGSVRARKQVESTTVAEDFDKEVEHLDEIEHVPGSEGDSGEIETLPDGSLSIPVFEERLVVTKQVVVRERVVIRKRTITETERVETELRSERLALARDEAVAEGVEPTPEQER